MDPNLEKVAQLPGWRRLTQREQEIARLAAGGCSHRQIAERLNLSLHTVRTHIHSIHRKLGRPALSEFRKNRRRGVPPPIEKE